MKKFLAIIVSLLWFVPLKAQVDSTANTVPVDSTTYDFIVLDSRFQNQFAFWGRDFDQKLPFLSNSVMYYFHSGFWVNASHFKFFNESIPAQLGLTLGYFKEVTPTVDWHSSYSLFYVPEKSIPSALGTQQYVQTTIGFDWGILFSSFQAHALINQQSDVFFSTYHSRYFEFNKLLWRKVKVSFEPKFSFTFGTHRFEYADGLVIAPGGGGIISQPGTTEDQGNKIQALNWDVSWPFKFAVGSFSIEPSWRYTTPLHANPDYTGKGIHQFAIGVTYSVPIKR